MTVQTNARIALATSSPTEFQRDLIALMPLLRAYARSICRGHDLGDDLTQETLARAWRAQARFVQGTNLKAWLFTILRNEYYTQRRRAWRQSCWDETKAQRIAGAPDQQLWSLEMTDTANLLHELPDQQREALVLVAAGGVTYEEAAKICKTEIGTVKSRVARGRLALLQRLNGEEKPTRHKDVSRLGGFNDILAQLSALVPASVPAYA